MLILCVDLGTDIFPAVSFAYEDPELDIMTRAPRENHDHLVSGRLLCFAYLQMGIIQTCGGYVCYFMVMNDFGFPPMSLPFTILKEYYPHNKFDIYNKDLPFFGNSNLECNDGKLKILNPKQTIGYSESDGYAALDWLFLAHSEQDLRMGYLDNSFCSSTNNIGKSNYEFGDCKLFQVSPVTHRPVCYTTEALKYAQTSFFFSIVITQFSNCKFPC